MLRNNTNQAGVPAAQNVAAGEVAQATAPAHEYSNDLSVLHITPTQLMLGICSVLAFGICLGNSFHHDCHPHDFHY